MEVKSLEQAEAQVERLLGGLGCEVTECDVGLEQSKPASLRNNVTYIVCGVIFNDKDEVLMVQEAKQDCYKKWYLPAGRVEVGESLQEALLREVKEEAGFECQPITLLLIQEQGPQWIRFIFLAKITGGSIKTTLSADQDSLQAAWWDRRSPLPLRGRDILRLIDFGIKYRGEAWHPAILPLNESCRHVVQRLVLIFREDQNIWILLVKGPSPHIPTAAALKTHAVTWAANMVVQDAMPSAYYDHNVNTLGVLSLQHDGRQQGKTDGVCFNTLVALQPDRAERDEDGLRLPPRPAQGPPPVENPRYVWHRVLTPGLREKLLEKTQNTSILPMHSLY
ncbi:8-oxo-dGDP phosphatase NUDT18 [Corythoichthys intestinalis]|uniref:8-oxo-dGDP phosphatase NUDT18 n=1 Tax=Corythoichthys intestinalis TaxID=161448 RepID=UPI0025A56719|nr:8-oxo-dGDP phosphatase NUDT18 [Corythoichthys intestinalis]XP_057689026.1 8-oxo-dGDP phosphatase NUDT18 [Corythoichthys intestinalis]XP_061803776.1 8-oxo-dGDP phosphatase NUDT18-like [Nerophis lumbriciformis]